MSTFHVCVMRGGWAITMLVREEDSHKMTEDIAYYISPIDNLIISCICSSIRATSILLQRLLTYVKVLRQPQHADGPWPGPMTLTMTSVEIILLTECHNDYPQAEIGTK